MVTRETKAWTFEKGAKRSPFKQTLSPLWAFCIEKKSQNLSKKAQNKPHVLNEREIQLRMVGIAKSSKGRNQLLHVSEIPRLKTRVCH